MRSHNINFSDMKPHGKTNIRIADNIAILWTTHSISGQQKLNVAYKKHYISLPDRYRLPLRIDMTIKLDYPAFALRIGEGHVYFASGHDTQAYKIWDITIPDSKPSRDNFSFDNRFPFGEYVHISVILNLNEMQVWIGDEERFYSRNQPYMKKKQIDVLSGLNAEGFELGFAVTKHSTLCIRDINITQYDDAIPIIRGDFELPAPKDSKTEKVKPSYENTIGKVSPDFQTAVEEMDGFFKSLRSMKFKRVVDKSGCKLTYIASDAGISYTVVASGAESFHHFGWYIVYSGPVETWHRRADYMDEILGEIANTDQLLAERVFDALVDCAGCYQNGLCKTLYTFNGKKKLNCHGRVMLRMNHDDFYNVRTFFQHLNTLLERKIANDDPLPEKIILSKTNNRLV